MRQERRRGFYRSEKFEDGVLRADACSDRFSIPRDKQYRTALEDMPSYSFGSRALGQERALMADVYRLLAAGFTICGAETLEDFVARCSFQEAL